MALGVREGGEREGGSCLGNGMSDACLPFVSRRCRTQQHLLGSLRQCATLQMLCNHASNHTRPPPALATASPQHALAGVGGAGALPPAPPQPQPAGLLLGGVVCERGQAIPLGDHPVWEG